MTLKGWRLQFIFIGLFLTLLLLFGGEGFYRKYFIVKPLEQSLKGDKSIQALEVQEMPGGYRLLVSMGPVENIRSSYLGIRDQAQERLRKRLLEIVLMDKRSPTLAKVWQQAQFAIYEAAVRGNFSSMAERVEGLVRQEDVDRYALNVDVENIYLQLHQGDYYLYAIVPRIENPTRLVRTGEVKPGA